MDMERILAEERRARLAAERLLDQKSRELIEANRQLAHHSRSLSEEIVETREEAEHLRGQHSQVVEELQEVSAAIAIAERRLWGSLETIQDGFAVFDSDSRLVAANRAYLGLFDGLEEIGLGVPYDRVLTLAAEEGLIDLQGETRLGWIDRMMHRWQQEVIEDWVIRTWDGQYIKMIDRRTPDGDVVSLNLNMTEMMRMWAAVEAVPDGFVLFDPDDKLLMCNERYRQIYGASAEAIEPGVSFEALLRFGLKNNQFDIAAENHEDWLAERLTTHQKADQVVEQRLADGRWLRILEKETPDGGRVGLRVDITAQKEQQADLEDARIAAEAASRAKSAFLANMSHELRTPMNGVVGMADLICDTELSEEQRLYAETIKNSGEALLTLLNDVLDFSKIEAGKLTLNSGVFDLERSIHEVVMLLQATARDKDLGLIVDYDMFQPTMFEGDQGRVRQILTNLIGNAVKFTEKGHVLVRVVGLDGDTPGTQRLHITVEDTGIGIAPEMQAHIFGEFNQVEDERNRKFEGTGLGLAITKQLVEMMGGEIWLESEIGQGACFGFSLILPLAVDSRPEPAPLPKGVGPVFVVDDQEINRVILERQLSQLGLSPQCFRSAQDALAAMDSGTVPALILSDQNMPGCSGADFAAQLAAAGDRPAFLLLSSSHDHLGGPGIDKVLSKPVLRSTLIETVAGLLSAAPWTTETPLSEEQTVDALPADVHRMKVLTAEDNRTNRLVFSKMVAALNIDLRLAENGAEAVRMYREERPDLIFMDISMPEMDGKQATAEIRRIEGESGVPPVAICALTAHAMSGDADEILACGLDHYMVKPLKKDLITAMIERNFPEGAEPLVTPEPAAESA